MYAIISTSISPASNFVNTRLHGTATTLDEALKIRQPIIEKELPHWENSFDVSEARTVFSGEPNRLGDKARLIVEVISD